MKEDKLIKFMRDTETQQKEIFELVKQNTEKLLREHRLQQSIMTLLKNYDARIEALKNICLEASILKDDAAWEAKIDKVLELRIKTDEEKIEDADVVWVDYEAQQDGKSEIIKEVNFPVRVGSKAVMFEEALVGQPVNAQGVKYSGKHEGVDVVFTLNVQKVKTKIQARV